MLLRQPFPSVQEDKTLRFAVYAGLCVFLVLTLFRPFGLYQLSVLQVTGYAVLYGLLTTLICLAQNSLLPRLFPTWYREEKWTAGKEMLHIMWQLLVIGTANLLLSVALFEFPLSWHSLGYFLWNTVAVGIAPVGLIILLKQQVLLKKHAAAAAELDEELEEMPPADSTATSPMVIFTGDSPTDTCHIPAHELRFIEAADNYIRIHYVNEGVPGSTLLRSTLKKAEETLEGFPGFYRCHRTYIVNLEAIRHVSGNAQGYKLHLDHYEELIPVSRSLNDAFTQRLNQSRAGVPA